MKNVSRNRKVSDGRVGVMRYVTLGLIEEAASYYSKEPTEEFCRSTEEYNERFNSGFSSYE